MSNLFAAATGPIPARTDADRWRQLALLAVAAAIAPESHREDLGAMFVALDWPDATLAVCRVDDDRPWRRWWAVLATGQLGDLDAFDAAIGTARGRGTSGAEGRVVARRLAELEGEVAAFRGGDIAGPRLALLGARVRPTRRVFVAGRSSATFVLEPGWDALTLVRLGPSDGPSSGGACHLRVSEILEPVRLGQSGAGRTVPPDAAPARGVTEFLDALREAPADRDGRLLQLATEVREERERLTALRAELERERQELMAERLRTRLAAADPAGRPAAPTGIPATRAAAARVLGVSVDADAPAVEAAYRSLVTGIHPDRVAGLDERIRSRAEELTVALNAARDIMLGAARSPRRVRQRA